MPNLYPHYHKVYLVLWKTDIWFYHYLFSSTILFVKVFDLLFKRMVENAKILIVIAKVYPASYFDVEIHKHNADLPIVFMSFFWLSLLLLEWTQMQIWKSDNIFILSCKSMPKLSHSKYMIVFHLFLLFVHDHSTFNS